MYVKKLEGTITTDSGGDGSVTIGPLNGRLLQIIAAPDAVATPSDNYAIEVYRNEYNFAATMLSWTEASAATTRLFLPRVATVDSAMAAALYAGAGEPVLDCAYFADEYLAVYIDSGGDTKSLTIVVYTG